MPLMPSRLHRCIYLCILFYISLYLLMSLHLPSSPLTALPDPLRLSCHHVPRLCLFTSSSFLFLYFLSCPLLQLSMWRYWFPLSRYVYGGNRSFAPILRQSRWSLLYDVYWLVLMMVFEQEQRDRNTWTQFRIRIVLFSFEQWIKQGIDEKWNQPTKRINSRTANKINER